jgi:hypothetical protein
MPVLAHHAATASTAGRSVRLPRLRGVFRLNQAEMSLRRGGSDSAIMPTRPLLGLCVDGTWLIAVLLVRPAGFLSCICSEILTIWNRSLYETYTNRYIRMVSRAARRLHVTGRMTPATEARPVDGMLASTEKKGKKGEKLTAESPRRRLNNRRRRSVDPACFHNSPRGRCASSPLFPTSI